MSDPNISVSVQEKEVDDDVWVPPPLPFSEETFRNVNLVFRVFLMGFTSIFGVSSNILNVIIFYRQGILSHSSIVNLTALALSDFLNCIFALWSAICGVFFSFFDTSDWSWNVYSVQVITSGRPYNTASQITSWNTVFLAFERAISVTFPFKAKSVFTPKRSVFIMITIFVAMMIINIPSLFQYKIAPKFDASKNRSIVDAIKTEYISPYLRMVYFYTSPVTLRTLSVFMVVLCNIVIFWKVYLSQKFRKASAGLGKSTQNKKQNLQVQGEENKQTNNKELENTTSKSKNNSTTGASNTKEMRLVRMISLISAIFVLCYIPSVLHVILGYIVYRINHDYHHYVDRIVFSVLSFLQLLCASTNIFIYYNMSTRFREEFLIFFGRKDVKK